MKKHIPNTITCGNLVSGCIAITFALYGNPSMALLWIVVGAVFDFFDGMTARLLHVSSPIGKELDSLADVVTFGVAPSAMLFFQLGIMEYPSVLESYRNVLPYCAFLMAAFSALRLAKFNLDERQTTSFIGLPTPANALFWGALIVGGSYWIGLEVQAVGMAGQRSEIHFCSHVGYPRGCVPCSRYRPRHRVVCTSFRCSEL